MNLPKNKYFAIGTAHATPTPKEMLFDDLDTIRKREEERKKREEINKNEAAQT